MFNIKASLKCLRKKVCIYPCILAMLYLCRVENALKCSMIQNLSPLA